MKREIFNMDTASEVLFDKLGIRLPSGREQRRAKDVRIPDELAGNDLFFGA